jgi:hypothetical protein
LLIVALNTICFPMVCVIIISVLRVRVMVFNATINNNSVKSWWPVLLVDETVVLFVCFFFS